VSRVEYVGAFAGEAHDAAAAEGAGDAAEAPEAAGASGVAACAGRVGRGARAALVMGSREGVWPTSPPIQQLHFEGLREMQRRAALRAQQVELDRIRAQEERGVENLRPGTLLAQLPCSYDALDKGHAIVAQAALRATFMRAAFYSLLAGYTRLAAAAQRSAGGAALGRAYRAQALLAHVFARLPSSVVDGCVDELSRIFAIETETRKKAGGGGSAAGSQPVDDLVMQLLFTLYAQLAPAFKPAAAFAFTGAGLVGDGNGAGGDVVTEGTPPPNAAAVDLADPIRWMTQPKEVAAAAAAAAAVIAEQSATKKRRTEGGGAANGAAADADAAFAFAEDESDMPTTAYSHLACRITNTILSAQAGGSGAVAVSDAKVQPRLVQFLSQLPSITVPLWIMLHRHVCMSDSVGSVQLGITTLTQLIDTRPQYQMAALSLLLYYATCAKRAQRVFAIKELKGIVERAGRAGQATAHRAAMRGAILDYAAAMLGKIAVLRVTKSEATTAEALAANRQRLERLVVKHLSLFVVLCALDVAPIQQLLVLYKRCGEEGAPLLQNVLLSCVEVVQLLVSLCQPADPKWLDVLKILHAHPPGSEPLVWHILNVFSKEIQKQAAKDTNRVYAAMHKKFVEILVMRCGALYKPRQDVRFLIPVFAYLPRTELKQTYIPALLPLFADAAGRGDDIERALKNMISSSQIAFDDGERGISPEELLVYLHALPQMHLAGITNKLVSQAITWVLTRLKKRLPDGSDESVFGVNETTNALGLLMQLKPLPTLTLRTAILAARKDALVRRYVINVILKDLCKASIWTSDVDLWKGVVMCVEEHWPATADTLLSLPNAVLAETLHGNLKLRGLFAERVDTLPAMYRDVLASVNAS
jgi:hypothetical protein